MASDISGALLKSGSAAVSGMTSLGSSAHLILKALLRSNSIFTLSDSKKFIKVTFTQL
jgi:hypothetical protein